MEIIKIQKVKFTKEDQAAIRQVLDMLDKINSNFQGTDISHQAFELSAELSELIDDVDVDAELF